MQRRHRILVTHSPEARTNYFGELAMARLHLLGDVVQRQTEEILDAEALVQLATGCSVIVSDRATAGPGQVFAQLPNLLAFLRVAVDIRNIDLDAADQAGVLVCRASRSWVPAVSELILGLMIDASRGISRANIAYKKGRAPEIAMGRQLSGATAGIIGYGHLGRRMAKVLSVIGMNILVCDPYISIDDPSIARQVSIDRLLSESDYVLPLAIATDETENLMGADELALMKPSAFLINASRGNLVDETALLAALAAGEIAGAALDVGRDADQMPTAVLAAKEYVVATPHIGGLTLSAIEGQALEVVDQVAEIVAGKVPTGAVNAASASRLTKTR